MIPVTDIVSVESYSSTVTNDPPSERVDDVWLHTLTTLLAMSPRGISLLCWQQRTKLECVLLALSGVLFVSFILTVCIFLTRPSTIPLLPSGQTTDICLSPSCVVTAGKIIRSLDETQNPCEDFYEFACGGWIRTNPISEKKDVSSVSENMYVLNKLVIQKALEKANITEPPDAESKARIYYDSCIDANETIEKLGKEPLIKVIRDLGGWHLLNSSVIKSPKWSLQKLLQDVQNGYSLKALFDWEVTEDEHNSSKNVIYLRQGSLSLPRNNYLNKKAHKKVLDAYLDYMTRICVLLGANKTEARAQMSKVIQFERDLANITVPLEDRRNVEKEYNPYTIKEWQEAATFLNWTMFFNDAFKLVNRSISDDEKVVVNTPDYFKDLTKVLEKYVGTEEGQKTVTSYMMWQVSLHLSDYLSESFRNAEGILDIALFGSEDIEDPSDYCITNTDDVFGFAVGALFVRETFHGEAKTQAEIMINNIKNAFKRNFKNLDWMDEETRKAAEIKTDAITDLIGFPDFILDKSKLDKLYEDLNVKPDEYFENYINFKKYSFKNNLKKLDQPVNKTEWPIDITPATINAFYSSTENHIIFPAGILQVPLYDGDNPKSINYGAMGMTMGHELTHAFDDEGRKYDRFGNLNQWWNNATINRFKKRAECIQKQYSAYKEDGQHLNGLSTLGENIADNGGLKASYHAYLDYSKNAKVNDTLPGLTYNHRQLFFISAAQVWCAAMTKEMTNLRIEDGDHTIPKYRVIGPMSNLKEFSDEFHCPLGSKMNPKHKCVVW